MKLYYSPGACSLSPHIALEEAGLTYEAIAAPTKTHQLPDGTDYYTINPLGYVPLLQLDEPLIEALHAQGFEVAVETNGTQPAPAGLDWICVSPKADAPLLLTAGDELKLVYPQPLARPERFAGLAFDHFFLQPMDGPDRLAHTRAATDYCMAHPQWRLGVQMHKIVGIE